jgi:hypothetical protein
VTDQDVIAALARVIKPGEDAKARLMAEIIADVMGVGGGAAPRPVNRLKGYYRDRTGGVRRKAACEQGERSDLTGCTPAGGFNGVQDTKPSWQSGPKPGPVKLVSHPASPFPPGSKEDVAFGKLKALEAKVKAGGVVNHDDAAAVCGDMTPGQKNRFLVGLGVTYTDSASRSIKEHLKKVAAGAPGVGAGTKTTPAPTPAPTPANVVSALENKVRGDHMKNVEASLKSQPGATAAQVKERAEVIRKATARMPVKALSEIGDLKYSFHESTQDMMRNVHGAAADGVIGSHQGRGLLLQEVAPHLPAADVISLIDRLKKDEAGKKDPAAVKYLRDAYIQVQLQKGGVVAGVHMSGKVYIGSAKEWTFEDRGEGYAYTKEGMRLGTCSHEITHGIDKDHKYSKLPEWQAAYNSELKGKKKLTEYAGTFDYEGFAEFGRILYSGVAKSKDVEKDFPKCAAFFKKHDLWPNE